MTVSAHSERGHALGFVQSICAVCAVGYAVFAPSCMNAECGDGETRCSGKTILRCVGPCSDIGCTRQWEREECSTGVCVKDGNFPFCALSTTEDPYCVEDGESCRDNAAVKCLGGFLTKNDVCEEPSVCVETDLGKAMCALASTQDARCAGKSYAFCDGNTLLDCKDGYAISETRCPVACVLQYNPTCALSATRDPACAGANHSYCDGVDRVTCFYGYATERQPCACADANAAPSCETDGGL